MKLRRGGRDDVNGADHTSNESDDFVTHRRQMLNAIFICVRFSHWLSNKSTLFEWIMWSNELTIMRCFHRSATNEKSGTKIEKMKERMEIKFDLCFTRRVKEIEMQCQRFSGQRLVLCNSPEGLCESTTRKFLQSTFRQTRRGIPECRRETPPNWKKIL